MSTLTILLLAVIQGLAELLPVSSSAHVILAERLLGLDPGSPEMSFLLVMLHTGTMLAVLLYFWNRWRKQLAADRARSFVTAVVLSTLATGLLGLLLKVLIEKVILEKIFHFPKGEVEHLFRILPLIAVCLWIAGALILLGGQHSKGGHQHISKKAAWRIGWVQGLVLPFRGLSRSGLTISAALMNEIDLVTAEDFSFALAVVLTPAVLLYELKRYLSVANAAGGVTASQLLMPGLLGMGLSFLSGLLALKWLSQWLEQGKWHWFGYYCFFFGAVLIGAHFLLPDLTPAAF